MKRQRSAKEILVCLGVGAALAAGLVVLQLVTYPQGPLGIVLYSLAVFSWLFLAGALAVVKGREARFFRQLKLLMQSPEPEEALQEEIVRGRLPGRAMGELLEDLVRCLQTPSTAEALKVEAELHALQNQINPHFLYNTLETIRSRAMLQGNTDVCEMVESLAMQFRYCINHPGEMATLSQELDHVHNYLLIQRYRFGDQFRYREEIPQEDERIAQCKLPVLTLQPLIENALIHGIAPRVEGGCITLRVYASKTRLYITLEDDGVGIPEAALLQMRRELHGKPPADAPQRKRGRSSGIAIQNVHSRIQLYFGENYGADVASTVGVGTCVSVTLPLICSEGGPANE